MIISKKIFPLLLATTGGLWQKGLPNVLLGSWQQLVRESPDFSSFSIEREETRLGRVYIIGVSVAPSCYHHSVLFTTCHYLAFHPAYRLEQWVGWDNCLRWLACYLLLLDTSTCFCKNHFKTFVNSTVDFTGRKSDLALRVNNMKL